MDEEEKVIRVFTIKKPKPDEHFVVVGEAVSIDDDLVTIRDQRNRLRIINFDDVVAANEPL